MNSLRPWHLLVLAIVFLVLFGSKRLPDSARSLGRSLRIFKSEIQEL
ncbi:MAG: Sec-independent protein translocase subunit TatA, partial [Actinobacteria bacterium]|nr:Sec-independent protein translocase subunit TatA [Actinomycetota bacterium]